MKYEEMLEKVKSLEFDTELNITEHSGTRLFIFRPSIVPPRFKNYDLKKNFQIYFEIGERRFKPNHLRMVIDLHLRVRSRLDLKVKLLELFDGIYYRKDPDEAIKPLQYEMFEHSLNHLSIIAHLSQLFIIEQDYCYPGESKYDPPTLFYQGWIRNVLDTTKEIDNICMSIANRQPPPIKYTCQEDKNHKNYNADREELWYLDTE
jgi:hypothetical protein